MQLPVARRTGPVLPAGGGPGRQPQAGLDEFDLPPLSHHRSGGGEVGGGIHRAAAPVEEAAPVIIEPIKPPPNPEVQKVAATDQNQSPAPQLVAVTLDTPAINFAVPTIGNLLVPAALAQRRRRARPDGGRPAADAQNQQHGRGRRAPATARTPPSRCPRRSRVPWAWP